LGHRSATDPRHGNRSSMARRSFVQPSHSAGPPAVAWQQGLPRNIVSPAQPPWKVFCELFQRASTGWGICTDRLAFPVHHPHGSVHRRGAAAGRPAAADPAADPESRRGMRQARGASLGPEDAGIPALDRPRDGHRRTIGGRFRAKIPGAAPAWRRGVCRRRASVPSAALSTSVTGAPSLRRAGPRVPDDQKRRKLSAGRPFGPWPPPR
jgi:hypothetical protein